MARKEAGFLREDDGREIFSGKPPVGEQGGVSIDEDGARAVVLTNFTGIGTGGGGTGGTTSSATTTTEGTVRLAGDLAGTSQAPTVPGLSGKASSTDRRFSRSVVPAWAASTLVDVDERRIAPDGREIQSNASRTTRATFDATESGQWTQIGVDTTDLQAGLAGKLDNPTGTKTTGYVPVVQSGGSVAWGAQSGSGSSTAAAVSYAGSPALPSNPATVEAAIDQLAIDSASTMADVDALQATSMTSGTVRRVEAITQTSLTALEAANQDESGVLYIITPPPYVLYDLFDRNVTDGLGTATTGGTWTINPSSSAADWDVINDLTDGYAQTNHSAAATDRYSYAAISGMSQLLEATFSLNSVPTAVSFSWFAMMRFTSTNQNYKIRAEITPTTVKLTAQKVSGGVSNDLGAQSASLLTYTAGTKLSIKAEVIDLGTTAQIRGKLWLAGGSEPGTWAVDRIDDATVGGAILGAGGAGFYTRAGTGATPIPNAFKTYSIAVT